MPRHIIASAELGEHFIGQFAHCKQRQRQDQYSDEVDVHIRQVVSLANDGFTKRVSAEQHHGKQQQGEKEERDTVIIWPGDVEPFAGPPAPQHGNNHQYRKYQLQPSHQPELAATTHTRHIEPGQVVPCKVERNTKKKHHKHEQNNAQDRLATPLNIRFQEQGGVAMDDITKYPVDMQAGQQDRRNECQQRHAGKDARRQASGAHGVQSRAIYTEYRHHCEYGRTRCDCSRDTHRCDTFLSGTLSRLTTVDFELQEPEQAIDYVGNVVKEQLLQKPERRLENVPKAAGAIVILFRHRPSPRKIGFTQYSGTAWPTSLPRMSICSGHTIPEGSKQAKARATPISERPY